MTKFYRTTFTIKVLSEGPLGDLSLPDIDYAVNEGDCVGYDLTSTQEELAPADMAKALIEAGSEPDFFQLGDDGSEAKPLDAERSKDDDAFSDEHTWKGRK